MAGREDWTINGFQFGSEKDAKQAKSEELKIQMLEEKMDYKNPQMVMMVYKKAIDDRIFKTPVGYDYLKQLQKRLKENILIHIAEKYMCNRHITFLKQVLANISKKRANV